MSRPGLPAETLLEALHLRDHEGLNRSQIAKKLRVSRGTIVGAFDRIDKDTDLSDPDGNQNGTVKPKWWKR